MSSTPQQKRKPKIRQIFKHNTALNKSMENREEINHQQLHNDITCENKTPKLQHLTPVSYYVYITNSLV